MTYVGAMPMKAIYSAGLRLMFVAHDWTSDFKKILDCKYSTDELAMKRRAWNSLAPFMYKEHGMQIMRMLAVSPGPKVIQGSCMKNWITQLA